MITATDDRIPFDEPVTPAIGDVINIAQRGDRRYRVNSFLKAVPKPVEPADPSDICAEVLYETALEAYEEREAAGELLLVACPREEAEFVSGSGVSGTVARIEDCTVVGRVDWSIEQIAEATASAARKTGRTVTIRKYWER